MAQHRAQFHRVDVYSRVIDKSNPPNEHCPHTLKTKDYLNILLKLETLGLIQTDEIISLLRTTDSYGLTFLHYLTNPHKLYLPDEISSEEFVSFLKQLHDQSSDHVDLFHTTFVEFLQSNSIDESCNVFQSIVAHLKGITQCCFFTFLLDLNDQHPEFYAPILALMIQPKKPESKLNAPADTAPHQSFFVPINRSSDSQRTQRPSSPLPTPTELIRKARIRSYSSPTPPSRSQNPLAQILEENSSPTGRLSPELRS